MCVCVCVCVCVYACICLFQSVHPFYLGRCYLYWLCLILQQGGLHDRRKSTKGCHCNMGVCVFVCVCVCVSGAWKH